MALPPDSPEDVPGLPPDVALAHAFVNSLDLRTYRVHGRRMQRSDAWETPQALERWLRGHALLTGTAPATTADLGHARDLRLVLRNSTRQPLSDDDGREEGMTTLTSFPFIASVGSGTGVRLIPLGEGLDAALSRVLIVAAELTARGVWTRMKMCPADDCQWIFFDRSRPGRARWCSPELCGNRLKVRAHRQRQGSPREPAEAKDDREPSVHGPCQHLSPSQETARSGNVTWKNYAARRSAAVRTPGRPGRAPPLATGRLCQ